MRLPPTRLVVRTLIALLASAGIAALVELLLVRSPPVLLLGAHEVEFLAPRWFTLLALLPWFPLVLGESLSDLALAQQALAVLLRGTLLAGATIALARPTTLTRESRVATALLVDVSASVSDAQLAEAQAFVEAAFTARRGTDELSVITFAERPRLLPSSAATPPRLARHTGAELGTDIQAAVQLAYGLFPPGTLPRAVILSDGNQTAGDLLGEAYQAKELGVELSVRTLAAPRIREIRAVALRLPDEIEAGAAFEVVAEILSTHEAEVTLLLRQDDFPNGLEPRKKVRLTEGVNRVAFRSEVKVGGYVSYRLVIDQPEGDADPRNNVTVATAPVRGKPRVLYVEGEPSAASYLERALIAEKMDVEVRGPRGLPSKTRELDRYDLVLVSDVPAAFVGLAQMQALEEYVQRGGGFIMAGGQDSFGSGGYQGTRIEKLLPVRFDGEKERSQPSLALALVIDRSGSMSGEKLEMAKESARVTTEALDASDLISVIAFDNQPYPIVRLQRAANRLRIASDIAKLQPGGGTNILPALQEAQSTLGPASAKVKHIILLSDGQANVEGIAELCDELRKARITVSAVGIGDADRNMLQMIAERGAGRLYLAQDASELPRIFMKETSEVQKSTLVEEPTLFHIAKRVEAIEGTGVERAPFLHGYVSTKPKPLSEVIGVSDGGEPLLARWRVGSGQVVAWTSDVKNRWAWEWLNWPGYQKFWAQLVRSTMRDRQLEGYDLLAEVSLGRARVVVDAIDREDRFVNDLATTLVVRDPATLREVRRVPMDQTAAGRYEADFPVDRYGSFILEAEHRRDGREVARSTGAVALPYPAELLRSTPDPAPLTQAATVTGGTIAPEPARIFDAKGATMEHHKELFPYVLLGVAALFVLDVYLRRVRLFGYRAVKF